MTAEASKKILVVFGTRPEAIKMAPVIKALENEPDRFRVITCVRLMQHQQSLADLTARAMRQVSDVFARTTPDLTLVSEVCA